MTHHSIDYDRIAAAYARNRRIHPQVLKHLCEEVSPASTVLEVGCGTGNYIVAVESIAECTCWGIEPSLGMLDTARTRSPTICFRQGSAEKMNVPDSTFDLIFSVDVIHHLDDRSAYIREAHRALKPGGKLCTVTDSEWVIRHRVPLTTYFPETVDFELARYPRIAELRAVMAQVAFDEIVDHTVEWTYALVDAQPYREKAFSVLHLIPECAFQNGLARLEHDLDNGPIPCVSRYTMIWGSKR
jgi:ubiquinone/menaquinone biosynthesis C-methylase UbiE